MLCNDAEYKRRESWSVVHCTELNKDLLQATRLGLLIFYDTMNFCRDAKFLLVHITVLRSLDRFLV
jgi:hypothetical protein